MNITNVVKNEVRLGHSKNARFELSETQAGKQKEPI